MSDKENIEKTEAALVKLQKRLSFMKKKVGKPSDEDERPEVESEDEDGSFRDLHFSSTVSLFICLDIDLEH